MESVIRAYNTVFYERADPRVKDWSLMTSPWPLVSIIVSYLTVIKLLPFLMHERRPYDLRTVIKWYNVLQIVSNAVVTWGNHESRTCRYTLMMTSPWPLVSIIVSYLTVNKLLPFLTHDRRPYDLQTVIKWYNVLQIVSNAVVTWGNHESRICRYTLMMTSPWPLVSIIVSYLTVNKLLPFLTHDRRPYDLQTVVKWYNVLQIVSNAVLTWGIMTSGWTTTYHFGCMLPDYSMNPEALRMLRFLWWTIILKLMELFETVFFLLRKKQRQASFLHIYHHVSTLVIIWSAVKYVGGGITSFSPMINNAVHVIMYSYYLMSSEGSPKVKTVLIKYKKWLTIMQMIQFTLMLIYSAQVFLPSCPAPLGITFMYFPNVIFVYYMFYKFFMQNYIDYKNNKQNFNRNGMKSKD